MQLDAFIVPLGIAALSSMLITASFALFRRRNPRLLLKMHKAMAAVTITLALSHATCIIISGL